MQEAEEQDTCRICSAPAEPDQPLFYPCKCSGTIRYIHQDCLTTWLAHSKKKNCDVCKHPYSFTKVYAPDMPMRLPPVLLIRRLAQQSLFALLFGIRAIAVGIIWLAVLPWVTVWTWRMYFSMGDSTAWWISDRPRPTSGVEPVNPFYYNVPTDASLPPPDTFLARLTSHPLWLALSADIFTGQIIASLIVLTFVAVFLLREWISQNARPGVFEDEEIPPEERPQEQAPPPPAHAEPEPQPPADPLLPGRNPHLPPRMPLPDRMALAQAQREAMRAVDAMRALDGTNGRIVGDQRYHHGRPQIRRYAKKGKEREDSTEDVHRFDSDLPTHTRTRVRTRSPDDDLDRELDLVRMQRKSFSRRIHAARVSGARRRAQVASPSRPSLSESDKHQAKFEFTFRATPSSLEPQLPRRSFSEPRSSTSSSSSIPSLDHSTSTSSVSPIFPTVELQPPVAPIPFSFNSRRAGQVPSPAPFDDPGTPSAQHVKVRRPPLPSTMLPTSDGSSPSLSPKRTPLDSPRLATYRAPEEFEAGPSRRLVGYFDEVEDGDGEVEMDSGSGNVEEHGRYFREPGMGAGVERECRGENLMLLSDEEGDNEASEKLGESSWGTLRLLSDEEGEDDEVSDAFEKAGESEGTALSDEERSDGNVREVFDKVGEADKSDEGDEEEEEDDGEDEEGGEYDNEEEEEEEEEGLFEEDAPWEEEGVERDEDEDQARARADLGAGDGAGGAGAPQPQQGPADAAVAAPEANEELDGNVEDDMEGAMEAIGMRGPIYSVVQNAALMIFVLDTAIGLGVWIPFMIGKSTALLSLDPHRFLQILHLPIKAMRIVTDPVVDSVVFIIMEFVFPPFLRLTRRLVNVFLLGGLFMVGKIFGQGRADKVSELSSSVYSRALRLSQNPLDQVLAWSSSSSSDSDAPSATLASASPGEAGVFPAIISSAEPYFAVLGREVRLGTTRMQATWTRLALGQGPSERAFAVALGYAVVGVMLSLYLNILTVGNVKSAGRAVRSAVRQQLLVLKVATFIFIELVTFPLGCGVVLDLCTVWLFPEASLLSRVVFFFQAPLTAMFYHWVAGTMFMYSFAILLSGCRSVMRPGAMWFIKDPQDQNSHPIRDILDRPTLTQLRKICVSGLMYSFVVACVVGSVAGLLLIGSKSIMPFRWKNREPLSNVPVDLLFLHLVLPYTMHYFRPRKALKKLSTALWKFLATRLRLTSYFFGDRYPIEEYTPKNWKANLIRSGKVELDDIDPVRDGAFRRVPATDNIALPRDMRATAAVTEHGEPVDDASRELMAMQNAEAEKAKRIIKDDYIIVYIPPKFQYRVLFFISLLWVIGAMLLGVMFALPIQLGRSFFKLFTPNDVHDGYSFIVGFYLLWGCYIIGKAIDRLDKRRQRRGGDGPRADLRVLVVKRGLLWIAKISYMIFFLGIVIPTLISFVMDLYIVLPIRYVLNPNMTPRIRVVDTWALGLLYAKIALHANRMQNPNQVTRGLQHITNNGWTHPDPVIATKEVIGPVAGGLAGMILFPGIVFRVVQYFLPVLPFDGKFIFMHVYPGIFAVAGLVRSAMVLFDLLSSWSQSIRDKEFLVEMRLRNHEPESAKEKEKEKEKEGNKMVDNVEDMEAEDSDT